jgi:uncharacterized protein (TIGR02231 family)
MSKALGVSARFLVVALWEATGFCSQTVAADIAAELHIDRVTVYRQGAIVTRAGAVNIPEGVQRMAIKGLPAGIEAKSLHVAVEGSNVHLGGIEIAKINEGKFVSEAERELRRKIDENADQRGAVQDEIATSQTQLKLLESLASNPAGSPTKATVDSANLASVLVTMSTSAAAARKRIREANTQLRTLDRDLETLKADLAKVATQSKQSTEVYVALDAGISSTPIVTLSYAIEEAGWQWIYQARLDSSKKQISLERQGQVEQASGEDWRNVELTLTTAQPSEDAATPKVGSLFLNLREPAMAQTSAPRAMAAPALSRSADLQEVVATSRKQSAQVLATDYLAEYRIPARVSLLANREPRLYPIAEDAFDVDLVARVVPGIRHTAYLEARFKYGKDVPIESGELQLYRDGAFVGEAQSNVFLPGADVRVPFGADERIRVTVHDEQAQSAQSGLITKQISQETRQRFEITNFHPSPIVVEVIDRVPVSNNADVHVETLKGATEPTTTDLDGKTGVLLWKFEAQPQKTVAIHQYYSVRYPRDRALVRSEGDASD